MGRILDHREKLLALARQQHGYFTAAQALHAGYAYEKQPYHVKQGNWRKIDRGLYRLPEFADSMESDFTRWALWSRSQQDQPQGVVSHDSALALHGWGTYNPAAIHLTVPSAFRKRVPAGCVLHKGSLTLSAVEAHGSFMATRPAQTLADMKPALVAAGLWNAVLQQALRDGTLQEQDILTLDADHAESLHQEKSEPAKQRDGSAERERHAATRPAYGAVVANLAPHDGNTRGNMDIADTGEPARTEPDTQVDPMTKGVWNMIYTRTSRGRRLAPAGFTLVELLVVLAVITILAAFLLPSLRKTVDTARQISCLSNMKQVGMGFAMYTHDSNGLLPYYILTRPGGFIGNWGECMLTRSWPSSVFAYHNTTELYFCPCDPNKFGRPQTPAASPYYYTSYLYRYGLAHKAEIVDHKSLRISSFAFPSKQIFMYERSDYHGQKIGIYTPYSGPIPHLFMNAAYIDGHVKVWKMKIYNVANSNWDPGWFTYKHSSDPGKGYDD